MIGQLSFPFLFGLRINSQGYLIFREDSFALVVQVVNGHGWELLASSRSSTKAVIIYN